MSDESNNRLEEKLRSIIETIDAVNTLTEPITHSIEKLLQISAAKMNSEEASVIVRDGDAGDMKFLAAIGKVAVQLMEVKIPSGKGIAGFVFSSGQPLAITNVGEEESFYAEVDRQTGYSTQTILATPLRYDGEIIGVLEYINRIGEPPFEAFTPDEMDKAVLFAEAIAALVKTYETAKLLGDLNNKMLSSDEIIGFDEMRQWLEKVRETAEHREMIELALIVREIASRGDAERKMSIKILDAVLELSNNQTQTSFLNFN
ncbi:MAG: GAF domain-containing protein [Acidobacteriota bacterium]|nr:GAF domain-containing protein [Acidobacteriota bacterium]